MDFILLKIFYFTVYDKGYHKLNEKTNKTQKNWKVFDKGLRVLTDNELLKYTKQPSGTTDIGHK